MVTMSRLPTPGSDDGTWGSILNDFLGRAHEADGNLKADSVGTTQLQDGSVTAAKASGLTNASIAANAGIVRTKLDTSTQSSLGLADTAVQKSHNDHINLLDYLPAGPDGNTNNSAIIRQAIIDAGAGPKRLFIPRRPQPWIIGTPVLIDTNIEIFSDGWCDDGSPCIQLAPGLNDYGFKFDTTIVDGNRINFRYIEIDGNASQQTAGGIIAAYNPVQCIFDAVHLHHAYDIALWLKGQEGAGPYGHHNRIVNCLFDNSATSAGNGRALVMQSADESMVTNSDFENNGNASSAEPYHIKDWSGVNSFVNCVFVGGGEGIRMQDIAGSRVVGCTFDGVGRDSVHVSGSNVQVANNHFSGSNTASPNSYFHLFLDNGGYCSVVGNVFDSGTVNNALRGFVSHQQSSTNDIVTGNVFRVNTGSLGSGGVYDWNGGSAVSTSSIVKNNIGLADQ